MVVFSDNDLIKFLTRGQKLLTKFGVCRSREERGIFPFWALVLSAVEDVTTREKIAQIIAAPGAGWIHVPEVYADYVNDGIKHKNELLETLSRRLGHGFRLTDDKDILQETIKSIQRTAT